MGLPDISSVFSRHFVVGYFIPCFIGAIGLDQIATNDFMPSAFRTASPGAQILVLGGTGLVLGLFLSGLSRPVLRLFEGYPLHNAKDGSLRRRISNAREGHWRAKYDSLDARRQFNLASPERTRAALELDRAYPANRERILPTRFGNVLRSFETHPRKRYGLDGVAIWPGIELLLSDGEKQTRDDAFGTAAFFTNSCVLVVLLAALLIIDAAANTSGRELVERLVLVLVGGAFAFSLFYHWAVSAVQQWGETVRAAFDLHRFDFFEKLGAKAPETAEEEFKIGRAVNRLLLFAEPLPDECRGRRRELKENHPGDA